MVAGLYESLTSQRVSDAGLVTTQAHPVAGSVKVLAPPYLFDGERLPVRHAPPVLGEATDNVLHSLLGIPAEEIDRLKASGVI